MPPQQTAQLGQQLQAMELQRLRLEAAHTEQTIADLRCVVRAALGLLHPAPAAPSGGPGLGSEPCLQGARAEGPGLGPEPCCSKPPTQGLGSGSGTLPGPTLASDIVDGSPTKRTASDEQARLPFGGAVGGVAGQAPTLTLNPLWQPDANACSPAEASPDSRRCCGEQLQGCAASARKGPAGRLAGGQEEEGRGPNPGPCRSSCGEELWGRGAASALPGATGLDADAGPLRYTLPSHACAYDTNLLGHL